MSLSSQSRRLVIPVVPGRVTFPIEIRAEAIAVFFKTPREDDRLIEGLQAQGVPYVFGAPGAKIVHHRRPVDYRHSTDIVAQLHEDVLL